MAWKCCDSPGSTRFRCQLPVRAPLSSFFGGGGNKDSEEWYDTVVLYVCTQSETPKERLEVLVRSPCLAWGWTSVSGTVVK